MALPSHFVWLVFQSVCVHNWTALAYQNYCLLWMVLSYAVTARRWNIAATTVRLSNFLCYRNVYHGNFFPFYLLPCSLGTVLPPLWQFRCHVCWGNTVLPFSASFSIAVSAVIFEDQEAWYPCFLWWFYLGELSFWQMWENLFQVFHFTMFLRMGMLFFEPIYLFPQICIHLIYCSCW